jgi:hypothetical protein
VSVLRVGPELSDPFDAFEVGQHQNVEESSMLRTPSMYATASASFIGRPRCSTWPASRKVRVANGLMGSYGRAAVPGRRSAWGCVRIVIGVDRELEHAMPMTARRSFEAAGSPVPGW